MSVSADAKLIGSYPVNAGRSCLNIERLKLVGTKRWVNVSYPPSRPLKPTFAYRPVCVSFAAVPMRLVSFGIVAEEVRANLR